MCVNPLGTPVPIWRLANLIWNPLRIWPTPLWSLSISFADLGLHHNESHKQDQTPLERSEIGHEQDPPNLYGLH